jgi:ABC-type Fe3+-hydroxamate transport system substrate-binding protein
MRRFSVGGFIATLAFLAFGLDAEARKVTDQLNREVELIEKPLRVVATAPSLAEMAADFLGADLGRLVGVTEYSDHPPRLRAVPSIGPYHQLNLEKIQALKPDLVLATTDGNSKDQIQHLIENGLNVVVVSTRSFQEIATAMQIVGSSLGDPEAGKNMGAQFLLGIARIQERVKDRAEKPTVLLQVGDDPLVVAGGPSFLTQTLEALGARNLYADTKIPYPRPALEDIVHRNPDVILILTLGADPKPHLASLKRWSSMKRLKATRHARLHIIQGDSVVRPTLRLLEGLALLERAIFGENQATKNQLPIKSLDGNKK